MRRCGPFHHRSATAHTSSNAAIIAAATAASIRDAALSVIAATGEPHSAEEMHTYLSRCGRNALLTTVRARMCDLHKEGLLRDSGLRGIGQSGLCEVVRWELVPGVLNADRPHVPPDRPRCPHCHRFLPV